jgi:hypothetical protein
MLGWIAALDIEDTKKKAARRRLSQVSYRLGLVDQPSN